MKRLAKSNLFFNNYGQYLAILAVIFYLVTFSFISLWKYYNFYYNALDLAIINQVFYNSSLGNFFASSIHPPTYLGDHFTPILFLLLPIYLLSRQPQTLLILQTVFLALCAWPVYLIAKKILNKSWAVILVLAWLINPFVQNLNLFEFHFLPIAVFCIFWAFYFYQNKNFLAFLLSCFLALMVREDVALVIFAFGLLAILEKQRPKWFLTPMILSVLYFIFAIKISGLFSQTGQYKFLLYYSWLGNSWLEIIKNVISHPWWLLPKIFSFGSIFVALALLLPTGYLSVLKPKYLLLSALVYLQLVIGVGWQGLSMILFTQYSALLLPGIFLAAIFALEKITTQGIKNQVINFLLQEKILLTLIVLTAMIYSSILMGPLLGSFSLIVKNGLVLPQTKIKNELLAKIPPQAAVAATYEALTPLSSRPNIASLNYVFLGKQQFASQNYALPENTEYLVIDYQDLITYQLQYQKNPFFKNQYEIARANWPNVLKGFGLIEIKDSLALYQKGAPDKLTLVEILNKRPELTQKNINLDEKISFLGFEKIANQYQLFWQVSLPLAKNYQLELTLADNDKIVYQKIYPFAYGLMPGEKTSGKKIVQTNYWFELPENIPPGLHDLKISLIEIIGGGIEVDAIRSTKNVIDQKNQIGEEILLEKINF